MSKKTIFMIVLTTGLWVALYFLHDSIKNEVSYLDLIILTMYIGHLFQGEK